MSKKAKNPVTHARIQMIFINLITIAFGAMIILSISSGSVEGGSAGILIVSVITVVIMIFFTLLFRQYIKEYDMHDNKRQAEMSLATQKYNLSSDTTTPPSLKFWPSIYDTGRNLSHSITEPTSGSFKNGTAFTVVNYGYTPESAYRSHQYSHSILHFQIGKHLPHLYLDSHDNDGLSTKLPFHFDQSQRIKLEGDFNKYFDLYSTGEQNIDALDVISPDFMEFLIRSQTRFDVEVVGTSVYVLAPMIDHREIISEIIDAGEVLSQSMAQKMATWSQSQPSNKRLISHNNQTTIKFKDTRFSALYLAPVIFAPLLYLIAAMILHDNEWVTNIGLLVSVGFIVCSLAIALSTTLVYIAQKSKMKRKQ